jgi:probable rRNA maturation factor
MMCITKNVPLWKQKQVQMPDRPRHDIVVGIEDDAWQVMDIDGEVFISHVIEVALAFLAFPRSLEISVLLTNNQHIQELNKIYRHQDKPTNVLSFPSLLMEDLLIQPTNDETLIVGDIILAFEKIQQEAKEQGKRFQDHLAHLTVHGLLHLLGYDHEIEDEAEAMEALEIDILNKLNVANPYI